MAASVPVVFVPPALKISSASCGSAKPPIRKAYSSSHADCRACHAAGNTANMSSSRHYARRGQSPTKLVVPGRASTGAFGGHGHGHDSYDHYDHYSGQPHSDVHIHRHSSLSAPRKTGGVIPLSVETFYSGYPSASASTIGFGTPREVYSGRPRRTSDADSRPPPLRTRPNIIQERDYSSRPSSPATRGYEMRESVAKPNTTVRRSEPKKTIYTVSNDSSTVVTKTEPYKIERRESDRRERPSYHLTGRSRPPQQIEEAQYSYTDPAGMFNDTEPVRRHHRTSVDIPLRRPATVLEPVFAPPPYHRATKDHGPPPTTRLVSKVNDLSRASSLRDVPSRTPSRTSSKERRGSYDTYGRREVFDPPPRPASTMPIPVVVDQRLPFQGARDDGYYRDNYNEYREPRRVTRTFADDNVATRGFGIRPPSEDRYRGPVSNGAEQAVPRSMYSQPVGAQSMSYIGEPIVKMPNQNDYLPPPPPKDDDRRSNNPLREREAELRAPTKQRYEERPRETDRPRDRDRNETREDRSLRHQTRRLSRDDREKDSDSIRSSVMPAAAAAAGVAGLAAVGVAAGRKREEKKQEDARRGSDSEREERNRPLRVPTKERDLEREQRRDSRMPEGVPAPGERDREERPREALPALPVPPPVSSEEENYRRAVQARNEEETRPAEREGAREVIREEQRRSPERVLAVPVIQNEIRKESPPATTAAIIDPDEEYRRRIQQSQAELAAADASTVLGVRSSQEDRSDSDRERQQRATRQSSRDRGSRGSRRGSEEDVPPSVRPRVHENDEEDGANQQHNRLPTDRLVLTDRGGLVQEPDQMPGVFPRDTPASYAREAPTAYPREAPASYPREASAALAVPGSSAGPNPGPGSGSGSGSGAGTNPRESASSIVAPLAAAAVAGPLVAQATRSMAERTPAEPDSRPRSADLSSTLSERERRVTIVEPSREEPKSATVIKGILRKPTEKFPEHPTPFREGVAPLKERLEKEAAASGGKSNGSKIPEGAKWTKIDRRLVNPQALEEKGERFEVRQDFVIVLRVLTKDEIQEFANRTSEIREEREEKYRRRHAGRSHHHHDTDPEDAADADPKRSSSRRHHEDDRDRDRDRERDGHRERERERDRDRERDWDRDRERERGARKQREYDDDFDSENDSVRRAVEEARRSRAPRPSSGRAEGDRDRDRDRDRERDRERDDLYMTGAGGK